MAAASRTAAGSRSRCSAPSARRSAPDYVVGIRLTGDEHVAGGRDPDECAEIGHAFWRSSGLIDFFNVVAGTLGTDAEVAYTIPNMGHRYGAFLGLARRIRRATGLPVFQASRIPDLSTARWAVEQGFVDMVGMTRAHIADPHIVAKLQRRRGAPHPPLRRHGLLHRPDLPGQGRALHPQRRHRPRGRPCRTSCRRATGPGARSWSSAAGSAAWRRRGSRALRGHEVVLLEATDRLGGQINLAAKAPGREEIAGIAGWLAAELELLGVEVRLNSYAEADDVVALEPGRGDRRHRRPAGHELPAKRGEDLVTSVWDVLGGYVEPAGSVLLYDDHGWHQGPSTAVALAKKGVAGRDRRPPTG